MNVKTLGSKCLTPEVQEMIPNDTKNVKLTEYLGPEPICGKRKVIRIMMAITIAYRTYLV